MPLILDPTHPEYQDEAATRTELTRVHDVCAGCRRCVDLCVSFTSLFDLLDSMSEPDAGLLTPAQQDEVVDACFHCDLCAAICPYGTARVAPDRSDEAVDVPATVIRVNAIRFRHGHVSSGHRRAARVARRSDLLGRLGTRFHTAANRVIGSPPGSLGRRVAARVGGVTAVRPLGRFASQRFSEWFAARPRLDITKATHAATVYPTCLVEYQDTVIGKDLVQVLERNGVSCSVTAAGCCGGPSLHAGDLDAFRKRAGDTVRTLAAEVRAGRDIVVPDPGCAAVLRRHAPLHVDADRRDDADMVAEALFDPSDALMRIHDSGVETLDTDFAERRRGPIVHHSSALLRSRGGRERTRDLLRLLGVRVRAVSTAAGAETPWALRASNDEVAARTADRLRAEIDDLVRSTPSGGGPGREISFTADSPGAGRVVAPSVPGDDARSVPVRVAHPMRLLAEAYGVAHDEA